MARFRIAASLINVAALVPSALAQCQAWQPAPMLPAPMTNEIAYDSRRHVTVAFGSVDTGGSALAETWEYASDGWSRRAIVGPSTRRGGGLAFDANRGVSVLFGGQWGDTWGETWEWDGQIWVRRSQSGPSARTYCPMVYDAARRVSVLFGGGGNNLTFLGDTWEWNGTTWADRSVGGPPGRWGGAMTYDSLRARTVLFGGYGTVGQVTGYLNDTWEWDGQQWSQIQSAAPIPRIWPAMTYDPVRERTVLFGGYDAASNFHYQDTWEWDGHTWIQRAQGGPPRQGPMVFDVSQGRIAMHVGLYNNDPPLQVWIWDGDAWALDRHWQPPPRRASPMVYDSAHQTLVFFGGFDSTYLGDTWMRSDNRWRQIKTPGPSPRGFHALAYDRDRGVTVLFGGSDSATSVLGDTWEFNGSTWSLRATTGPAARQWHAMAYDPVRRVTVLTGGWAGGTTVFDDTWEWNGTVWTQRTAPGLGIRAQQCMVYDQARSQMIVFGGATGTQFLNDTLALGASGWTTLATSGPSPRHYAAAAYDPIHQRTILTAGHDGMFLNDTWEWNGSGWLEIAPSLPGVRFSHAMAFDESAGFFVVFGGSMDLHYFDDTLEFPRPSAAPTQPTGSASVPSGSSVQLYASGFANFQWRRNGQVLTGETHRTLNIIEPQSGGVYDVRSSTACGTVFSEPITVTVTPPCYANCDGSMSAPVLNVNDFVCFYNRFAAAEPYANCDNSIVPPTLNVNDFTCFMNRYAAGCP